MNRFIPEFPGYFTPEDMNEMKAEFEAGSVPGEKEADMEARAMLIFNRYQFRRLSEGETDSQS